MLSLRLPWGKLRPREGKCLALEWWIWNWTPSPLPATSCLSPSSMGLTSSGAREGQEELQATEMGAPEPQHP